MAGSTFGTIFRVSTWGESHGKGVGVVVDGCPAGLALTEEDIQELVNLMLKISELDLDLEGLLNAAQSIYDKIKTADSGFWAKIGDLLDAIVEAIKNIFS